MGNAAAWRCDCKDRVDPSAEFREEPQGKFPAPLLLHFDVNKTVLFSDSLSMKSIEDGIREGISELFWGIVHKDDTGALVWQWTSTLPSMDPPTESGMDRRNDVENYMQFCKSSVSDKDARKTVMRSFSLVADSRTKEVMEKWVADAVQKLELPKEVVNTAEAEGSGLKGATFVMIPAFFHLVAALQDQGRKFAIVFRSFGNDHEKIRTEWNAFCELRHPVFSKLIQARGALDGTSSPIPDRRIHRLHTLYRDEDGPMLLLDTFTNGPDNSTWDSWAKSKPKPTLDTRGGRDFVRKELRSTTVDGVTELQAWLHQVLKDGETTAIKDDWAWWQFHGERSEGGKLLPLIGEDTQQIFFDDNVDLNDPKIVDCRYPDGTSVPAEKAMNRLCIKVNPVEALIDESYFLKKLTKAEGYLGGARPSQTLRVGKHRVM